MIARQEIAERAGVYADWIARFRSGGPVTTLSPDPTDPLASIGRELQLLFDSMERRERELQRLFDLVETIEQGVLVDDVLDRIFDNFEGLIPYDRIGCAFLSPDRSLLTAYWARSNLGPIRVSKGYSRPLAGSSLERILTSGHPRILNDLEAYLRAKPQSQATRRIVLEGGRSSLTCPLAVDHRPIGFLFFTSGQKDTYQLNHQMIFRQIANQVSAVVDRGRVYQQIIDRERKLIDERRTLEEAADHDALTGILNRTAILRVAQRALEMAAEAHRAVGFVMVDIDHFKEVNDSLGHVVGDAALKEFAWRLTNSLRKNDQLGRYGGEEFLAVVSAATAETLKLTMERLRRAVTKCPFDLGSEHRAISASFGGVLSTGADVSLRELISVADSALYEAKERGRNRTVVASGCGIRLIR